MSTHEKTAAQNLMGEQMAAQSLMNIVSLTLKETNYAQGLSRFEKFVDFVRGDDFPFLPKNRKALFLAFCDSALSVQRELNAISVLTDEYRSLWRNWEDARKGLWRSVRQFSICMDDHYEYEGDELFFRRKGWFVRNIMSTGASLLCFKIEDSVNQNRIKELEKDMMALEQNHKRLLQELEDDKLCEDLKSFVSDVRMKFEMDKALVEKAKETKLELTNEQKNLERWANSDKGTFKDRGRAASEVLVEIFCFCRVNPEHAVDLISEACGLEKKVIHSVWDISGEIWDYEDMKVLDANENDGADSRTYAARCKNVDVTLKLYNSASSITMNTLQQLLSNLRFKHPSIFTLTKFFVEDRTGWVYVEMPRVSGRLRDCIRKLDDMNTLLAFLHQIFFGVVKLHESGVVHGSVGPESVYVICPDEGSPRSQLILPKVFKEDTSKNKRDDIAAFGRLVQFVKENIPFLSGSNMIETKLILEIDEVIDACTNREDPSVADVLGLSFFRTVGQRKSSNPNPCVLCLNNSATVLVTPCGHLCFCASCRSQASELETCPLCRTVIEGIIDVRV